MGIGLKYVSWGWEVLGRGFRNGGRGGVDGWCLGRLGGMEGV